LFYDKPNTTLYFVLVQVIKTIPLVKAFLMKNLYLGRNRVLQALGAIGIVLLGSSISAYAQGGRPAPIGKSFEKEAPPKPIIIGLTPKAEIEVVREALDYAKLGKLASNTNAAVYATVVVQTGNSTNVANGTSVLYAFGRVTPVGKEPGDSLTGSLAISTISPTSGNPLPTMQKTNQTIDFSLNAKGRATFLWKIGGKPFLGRAASTIDLSANSKLLHGDIPYFGGGSRVTVRLSHSIFPLQIEEPSPSPKPASAAQPKGMRLRLDSIVKTTNSEDGVNDNICEMYGTLSLGGQKFWDFAPVNTQPNFTHPGTPVFYNIYFDKPETFLLVLAGVIKDEDEWSGDDIMWNASGTQVNLKSVYDSPTKSITINGDRKSESADLILTVSKVSDLY
jgi:hypothetical protein